jgi:acetyl/propionyl-CoA carboxylase alpha subunit
MEQHVSLDVLWRDDSEIVVRMAGENGAAIVRRFSYVRRGNELLLSDGYGYWRLAVGEAPGRLPHSGGRQGGPPTSGVVTSQMPGKVLDVRVKQGDTVAQGDVLLVLEAMKMEHAMTAPIAGVVKLLTLVPGERVMPGALLAEIEPAP